MIAVDHLTKRYGTVAAVDGLGFEVRQPNGLAIARRAVVLAGRCGTSDDRYSRRVGSRGRRGPGWPGADAGQVAGPVVVPGPGRPDVPAQTSRRADSHRRARRAGRVRGAGREPDDPGHGYGRVPPGQSLAGWLYPPMWTVQLSGVIGALPLVAAAAALLRRLRLAAATLLKVWLEAVAKMVVQRDRPAGCDLARPVRGPRAELSLRSCHGDLRDHRAGGPLLQRLVKGPALGAGRRGLPVTGVYLGAHFPVDVAAGAGLGLFIGSALNLVFGVPSASTAGASG